MQRINPKILALLPALLLTFNTLLVADEIDDRAVELAQQMLIADGHIDVPYRIASRWADVSGATATGDFDLPRARAGGLNVPFMSIYTPASQEAEGRSWQTANVLIDGMEALVARAPQDFTIVRNPAEARQAKADGKIGLALGMENGSPIAGDLDKLRAFHARGIRYVTLTHSLANHISDSSYDKNRPAGGLTPFGEEVVREMNRLGIMVDISHVSDEAFWDALAISSVPMIASHSSARHFTPGFERNMSDEMIKALAEKGGVIMINFGSSFISAETRSWSDTFNAAAKEYIESNGFAEYGAEYRAFSKAYREEKPFPFADLDDVLDHYDHVVKLVGVDHLGIGSDYDGVGDSLPVGLKDVASFPQLIAGLLRRGYSEDDVEKILGGNVLRVWEQVEAASKS